MIGRALLFGVLVVSIAVIVAGVCVIGQPPPSSTPVRQTATAGAAPTPSPSPSRTSTPVPATASPGPTAPASPGSTPAAACPAQTGGAVGNQVQLTAVRVGHNPGFDRVVFEFGPSTALGAYGMPPYQIQVATTLSGASGQPVPIAGNALFGVRIQNASGASPTDGTRTYTGPTSIKPATPLVREVRLVDDFERILVWGVGLDRLVCPQVLVLGSPVRLVLDFPTPP